MRWFKWLRWYAASSVLRCSPLNRALCDKAKFLGFSKFNLFGNSFFWFRQISIFGSNFWITQTVKHVKVHEVASLKIAFVRGKFIGRKAWKGQVYGTSVFAEISARLVSYKQKPNLRFNVAFRACGCFSINVEPVGSWITKSYLRVCSFPCLR